MRIILATNKTLPRNGKQELDTGYHYVQKPLEDLGHTVYFYDIISPEDPDFDVIVALFKPDLIFCCFTANPYIAPYEPWQSVANITETTDVKTFHWFCDDTWRFDNFSKTACKLFSYCSTPEPEYLEKYLLSGYNNILLGGWHANSEYYPPTEKDIDISFVGGMNQSREEFFSGLKIPVTLGQGLSIEELFNFYCRSKIGVNLSLNSNDPEGKTQMKQRVFELAAAKAVVLTEYHSGLEAFFDTEKEIVTFSNKEEFIEKANYLLANPEEAEEIAERGHARFLKDHESKIRLKFILEEVFSGS